MAVVSKNKGLAFGFEKSGVFSLLFLLTTLKIGWFCQRASLRLSKGLNELVKEPL